MHALGKGKGEELSSLYFRAKSQSMKVRLFHFKSPPTITNTNWSSKRYYKSLRWELGQNKTQQHSNIQRTILFLYLQQIPDWGHSATCADILGCHTGVGVGVGTTGILCVRYAAQHPTMHIPRPAPGTKNCLVQNVPRVEVEKAQPRELTILSFSLPPRHPHDLLLTPPRNSLSSKRPALPSLNGFPPLALRGACP